MISYIRCPKLYVLHLSTAYSLYLHKSIWTQHDFKKFTAIVLFIVHRTLFLHKNVMSDEPFTIYNLTNHPFRNRGLLCMDMPCTHTNIATIILIECELQIKCTKVKCLIITWIANMHVQWIDLHQVQRCRTLHQEHPRIDFTRLFFLAQQFHLVVHPLCSTVFWYQTAVTDRLVAMTMAKESFRNCNLSTRGTEWGNLFLIFTAMYFDLFLEQVLWLVWLW